MLAGTLPPAIVWSLFVLSFGLIGACIPSLMPLLSVLTGKRKLGVISSSHKYEKYGSTQSKNGKPERTIDSAELPLEENAVGSKSEIQVSVSGQNAFVENARLESEQHPGVITITSQIVQSHEPLDPSSPVSEHAHVIPSAWASHSLPIPAAAKVRENRCAALSPPKHKDFSVD